jgi:hypothetical protein
MQGKFKTSQKVQASIYRSISVPVILRERPAVMGLLKRSISRYVDWNLGARRISGFQPDKRLLDDQWKPLPGKNERFFVGRKLNTN